MDMLGFVTMMITTYRMNKNVNFLTSWITVNCCRKTLYHGVGWLVYVKWTRIQKKWWKIDDILRLQHSLPVNVPSDGCSSEVISNFCLAAWISSRCANVRLRISCAVRNTSKSRSRDCLISTVIMESIPSSANVECRLTVFRSRIPAELNLSCSFLFVEIVINTLCTHTANRYISWSQCYLMSLIQ